MVSISAAERWRWRGYDFAVPVVSLPFRQTWQTFTKARSNNNKTPSGSSLSGILLDLTPPNLHKAQSFAMDTALRT